LQARKSSTSATIQSVQRASALLWSFTGADTELGVTSLSKQLGLHKSTVSRLLATLQQEGFVEQNPETGKYHLGWGVVTLAGVALERLDVRQLVHPHLVELAQRTQETTNLTVLDGPRCINIDGVPSPHPIQYVGRIGRRTPTYCTSTGKVLLAHLAADKRGDYLPQSLTRYTNKTIVDFYALEAELEKVKAQGFAISDEELQEGLTAVAAPIFNHNSEVIAAIAVSGLTYRIGSAETQRLVAAVKQTAQIVSNQLGWRRSTG
jgi:DNA-binding IclR family transcriptional regulator